VTQLSSRSLFNAVDRKKTGNIDQSEFDSLYSELKFEAKKETLREHALVQAAAKSKRKASLAALFGVAMAISLGLSVTANFVVTMVLLEESKEMKTEKDGVLRSTGNPDVIVRTAEATQQAPLFILPALPIEQIRQVKELTVRTYLDATNDTAAGTVIISYTITGFVWNNSLSMHFHTMEGATIFVDRGGAYIVEQSGRQLGACAANATCSSATVSGINITAKEEEVNAMLQLQGHNPVTSGRKLYHWYTCFGRELSSESTDPLALSPLNQDHLMLHSSSHVGHRELQFGNDALNAYYFSCVCHWDSQGKSAPKIKVCCMQGVGQHIGEGNGNGQD